MNANEAWRVGNERRRQAQKLLTRCGIESCALCALKIRSREPEPVGLESVVEIVTPGDGSAQDGAIIVVFDEEGHPKACSAHLLTIAEAERLALAVRREAKASAPRCQHVKEVDTHGTGNM